MEQFILHKYTPFGSSGCKLTHPGFLNPHKTHLDSSRFKALPSCPASQTPSEPQCPQPMELRALCWQGCAGRAQQQRQPQQQLHSSWQPCSCCSSASPSRAQSSQPCLCSWGAPAAAQPSTNPTAHCLHHGSSATDSQPL